MSGAGATAWLAARSLIWALLLPGFFAGFLPWRYFGVREAIGGPRDWAYWLGLGTMAAGIGLLTTCIVAFARHGRGTLSPADPPKALVVQGLYRRVRNPMYLSVTVIVLGEVVLAGSTALLTYWVIWFGAANLFVMGYEEPTLRREFGAEYRAYVDAVPRWIPRLTPWRPPRAAAP